MCVDCYNGKRRQCCYNYNPIKSLCTCLRITTLSYRYVCGPTDFWSSIASIMLSMDTMCNCCQVWDQAWWQVGLYMNRYSMRRGLWECRISGKVFYLHNRQGPFLVVPWDPLRRFCEKAMAVSSPHLLCADEVFHEGYLPGLPFHGWSSTSLNLMPLPLRLGRQHLRQSYPFLCLPWGMTRAPHNALHCYYPGLPF